MSHRRRQRNVATSIRGDGKRPPAQDQCRSAIGAQICESSWNSRRKNGPPQTPIESTPPKSTTASTLARPCLLQYTSSRSSQSANSSSVSAEEPPYSIDVNFARASSVPCRVPSDVPSAPLGFLAVSTSSNQRYPVPRS